MKFVTSMAFSDPAHLCELAGSLGIDRRHGLGDGAAEVLHERLGAALRDPFTAAKIVGTASVLSGERVALGVGAGWMCDEFELLEKDFGTRAGA